MALKFNDERDLVLKTMMDRLGFLEKQSTPLEARIKAMCTENHHVRVLISTVGIDFYLASLRPAAVPALSATTNAPPTLSLNAFPPNTFVVTSAVDKSLQLCAHRHIVDQASKD